MEVQRMIRESRRPDVLDELFAALGRDPVLIEEILARPLVVERLARATDDVETSAAVACNSWQPTTTVGAPLKREDHTAIWTGAEMIVFGGNTLNLLTGNTGGRYDPATDGWTPTSTIGAPTFRYGHSAVWTGTKMVVWGGYNGLGDVVQDGGRYDVTTDSWAPTSLSGAPSGRYKHAGVWTGSQMIIWGGCVDGGIVFDSLAHLYRPDTDSWSVSSNTTGPRGQCGIAAVWTGSEMLVIGTLQEVTHHRYAPASDTWRVMSDVNPLWRYYPTAVWTGTEMIVWGGGSYLNTGARYTPSTDTWVPTPTAGAPLGRIYHTAVWSGSEMIVWGGARGSELLADGASYDVVTNSWTPLPTDVAPSPRAHHSAVWTGTEMIVWGGQKPVPYPNEENLNDGARYRRRPTAETCNGIDDDCDGGVDEGVSCDDWNSCNGLETCGGASGCLSGAPIDCNDGNDCTTDACDPEHGTCSYADIPNGTTCDDGNSCTSDDACAAGTCVGGFARSCDDGNACTTDSCNPVTGCVYTDDTSACDDGNVCTTDSCDPATGCHNTGNTNACDDGNGCTTGDICGGGACNGAPAVCTPLDQCHVAGVCSDGVCSNPSAPDGTTCDDGNAETDRDVCTAGACTGASSCAVEPKPKNYGYYKKLCKDGHSHPNTHEDVLTDQDALCVGSLTNTFAAVSTVEDLCAVLENGSGFGDGAYSKECVKGEQELMTTALNLCRHRICLTQEIDSHCDGGPQSTLTTVQQSLDTADDTLSDPDRTRGVCKDAKCLVKEINNGHGVHHTSLHLSREAGNKVRLSWDSPVMDDGTGEATGYTVWRRELHSAMPFVSIGATNANTTTFVDDAPGAFEYEVSFTIEP
jgi:hypothetical protein